MESAFGVKIVSRGNQLFIMGKGPAISNTRQILEALWSKIQQGQEVDTHTVDAAIRFLNERDGGENGNGAKLHEFTSGDISISTRKKKIQPRTPLQADYMKTMRGSNLVFGVGPAGTGKTYLAVAQAVAMMEGGEVERIILTRPAVEAGERIGFLPGEMKEKMDPYMRPLYDALHDTMAAEKLVKSIASEEIEIAPLAFMRGRTLNNAFIILDEAQNATTMQMLMFLTRLGESSRMVVTGDPSQTDLPKHEKSGLSEALEILSGDEEIGLVKFTDKDVVRHPLVSKIIKAYDAKRKKDK
ncbi:MAG: PhoH family protein [Proteobacteria bacterium]|nr:PhoH family protein [Pseudomonadota bacterium]